MRVMLQIGTEIFIVVGLRVLLSHDLCSADRWTSWSQDHHWGVLTCGLLRGLDETYAGGHGVRVAGVGSCCS